MKFNTLKTRLVVSFCLAAPSYLLLWTIRGYDFKDLTLYGHLEYSTAVFIILVILFEGHHQKSMLLEKMISWKEKMIFRFWLESLFTILFTPLVVTPVMVLLYITIWDMSVWFPGMIEYNLFALPFSFLIVVFVNIEGIIEDWKKSLLENEMLEKENAKARLNALQAQISPHFLFNNFNVLNALIDDNQKLAQQYLDALSDIYRYVLNYKNEELVSLTDEVGFIKKYLFLLQIRFDDKVVCDIDIGNYGGYKVPPATLQILVENAVKHNEISSRKPLMISIKVKSDFRLEVRNNLQPKNGASESTEVGLKNVSDRFKCFTDLPVEINQNEEEFTVLLPVLKFDKNEYSYL
ncbi:MAG: sensor histidine kinase [Balneolaceae bacterium]|nr:sensor histidine kinase [Balneolaceae bacterium]MBO6547844.1 sensor histidine kinase [Balneolaceae bacterium]MBO6648355.1 sensor histidine kinase [Balneolaceae bacterium]